MEAAAMRGFERDVLATGIRRILQLELSLRPDSSAGALGGCGLLVVNPPYRFDAAATAIAAALAVSLAPDGTHRARWLAAE
jgi:23S rRNA (adenine2030-N6)-methyltransferase